jgi:hypothetical protein
MSMDLASFAAGIDPSSVLERLEYQVEYPAPPKPDLAKGMRYVDTYIKVFYYPQKVRSSAVGILACHSYLDLTCCFILPTNCQDVMAWIIENHEKYSLNHCLTLVANAYRGNADGATVEDAMGLVRKMFQEPETSGKH